MQSYFHLGECWAGNDQTNFQRDGAGSRCIGRDFKHCPETDNMCPPNACAGEWSTNKVYEIHQGPLACLSNPCKNGTCKQNGPDDFTCECPSGKTGKLCE
ncbi:venom prothrombin activator vestarin-D1-like [Hydractinia symbiolongicarpus]|uniref:venom prothrombin activator vestarin-D1-like n=1 Tax=Hydractinia symbiolongicarpus TaxID=13093 RepID=UPI00254F359F|nr:venom prothrombin activator vestarin-D1-like [Hydractinia symbiolongicarpus]